MKKLQQAQLSVHFIALGLLLCGLVLCFYGGEAKAEQLAGDDPSRLFLSTDERQWLSQHPTIRIQMGKNLPPYEMYSNEEGWQGLSYDYLMEACKRLGLAVEVTGLSFAEALPVVGHQGGVDLILGVVPTAERAQQFAFTKPLLPSPQVIVTRKDSPFIAGMEDLEGQKIAVEESYIIVRWLKRDLPSAELLMADNSLAALELVSSGVADAYIGNLTVAAYLIQINGLANLKIAAPSGYKDIKQTYAVRKDWPQLAVLLDKAFASFSREDHERIKNRWLSVRYEHGIRLDDVIYGLTAVLSLALVVIVPLYLAIRKRSKQLTANQRLLNAVMDNSFQFQGLLNTQGRLLKVNSTPLALIGCDEADVVGRDFWDTPWWSHDPQEQARLKESIQKGARGESLRYETYHLDSEGKRHDVDFALKPLTWNNGEIQYLIAEGHDITNLKERERHLKESEQRFHTLFDESPVIMSLNDMKDGTYIDVNRKFCEMNGVTKERVLGKTSREMNRVSIEEEQRLIAILEEKGKMENEEIVTIAPNGALRHQLLSTTFLTFDDKNYSLSMLVDITERRKSQQALRKSEEKLRAITESVNDVIWELDENLRFTFVSPSVELMQGWNEQEMLSFTLPDVLTAASLETAQQIIADELVLARTFSDKRSRVLQLELLRKDGSSFWGEISGNLILEPSGAFRIIGITRDISERKKTEQVMIDAEKMMMISGLAAGMAHEINNPLGIVLQNAQNIERRLSPRLESNSQVAAEVGVDLERVRDYLERRDILSFLASMRQAGERATKIVANMLAFSRKGSSVKLAVQINQVIDKAIEIARSDYDLKKKYDIRNVRFVKDYARDLPAVAIDETEIEQVLINLFKNAAQAMAVRPDGASEPTITIATDMKKSHVVVRVSDNGPGMPPQVRARIFEPFFTTKEVGMGTGLGLYVSYSIITSKHQGHLSVESEPGRGATFTIELPSKS
ncbi:MAG: PAS domain S-box protein [Desulfuromonadaceae bacterium]|nr:PAS domain S-box protein [Desulfuromonadaceae bacterium]